MRDFGTALALVLVIEGLAWASAPRALKRAAIRLAELDETVLRVGGLAAAGLGVLGVWLVRG
ncbi:MAG: DUF2065 domain-containing protein [Geminicoccaceae bacterium]|nr:DUF2065 domain-containing protein [Geminicoccaceae bacterium]MCX8099902.1 DUF2065 domain-containing protein [Geminicoccaceae bacterium]MDW8368942.1 DUF2065 domain-containing protein [Geminicoccaceae bacterium]